ncbi:helix-turn-helix transcriptional regulator [Spirosoma spitsbergense]|uniref:helix-turn-helix transcriptional regulator n=1 Tax=Spirosoma spitsbergense TaxID=431554 RepID=UPI000381931A|nr:helix-turn-helix transcriptional regulator [Spirosoma spitsbergense]
MMLSLPQRISSRQSDTIGYKTVVIAFVPGSVASPVSQLWEDEQTSPVDELTSQTGFSYGHAFLERLSTTVNTHLDDPSFSVEQLARASNMSRTQLYRKLKAVTHTTATLFIRDIRLARAAELLAGGLVNVTQVAYSVGFGHLSYFARVFHERYGVLPSQYSKLIT